MPSNYFKGNVLPDVKRVRQITASHCGPAALEMLLSKLGISVSQTQLADAGGGNKLVINHGMTIQQMARAIENLFPDLSFWYKFDSELYDLRYLVELYHYPVGVEWQGEFDHEDDDGDPGHYGVVTHVDMEKEFLLIADPYYPIRDRRFKLENFNERWWDINEIEDPETEEKKRVYDNHLLFVITPKSSTFPSAIGMSNDARVENR
ncbi:C39 family peptidase [Candidatus Microgenomates bacterium]|nr:C39 family peptidase [Candidatus Microgenomates bacterium]